LGVIDLQMIVLEQNVCSLFYAWIFFSVANVHRGGSQVQDVQQRQNASTCTPFVNSISIPAAQIVGQRIMQQPRINISGYASPIGSTNPVILHGRAI
jgi:hypothetical protein